MRTTRFLLALGTAALAPVGAARGQSLGPFRQFLAVEPYYVNTQLDDGGSGAGRTSVHGYGARLWLNAAPFSASRALSKTSVSLFVHGSPMQSGVSTLHYGASIDQYLVHRPLGGVIDPLISLGGGAYRHRSELVAVTGTGAATGPATASTTKFALTPGVGLRLPIPNRLELRVDARDAVIFDRTGASGSRRTVNNYEFTGALGITF